MKRRDVLKYTLTGSGLAASGMIGSAFTAVAPEALEVLASTLGGDQIVLKKDLIEQLQRSINGRILQHNHPGYDATRRVWNALVDKYPALIVQCAGPDDVVAAINFARRHELLTSVRCGGHNYAGKAVAENGLMIDLSLMNKVEVDANRKIAWVGGGARLGDLDRATVPLKLATTAGNDSDTGIGGLTLGGGLGRLNRMYGLTIDNLLGADIITADGILRRVSTSENPELFWAIRGGGGNFGVVTRFKFQLHEFNPVVYGGHIVFPWDKAREFMTFFAEFERELPNEMYVAPLLFNDRAQGRLIAMEACCAGDYKKSEQLLAPVRKIATPLQDSLGPTPYLRMQTTLQPDDPQSHYIKSGFVTELGKDLIDAVVDYFPDEPGRRVFFQQLGGAVSAVPPEATAFQHRSARFNVGITAEWQDTAEFNRQRLSVKRQWRKVMPHTMGFYTNLMEHGPRNTRHNYGINLHRLVDVKTEYDPGNLFRLNANIPPAV